MVGNGRWNGGGDLRMSSKLYVGNLPFATTAQDLQELFSQAGGVTTVDLIFDKFTGRSRGFAFITMGSADEARTAVEQFSGFSLTSSHGQ
jgi:cold-inducible RNA-binding protein